MLAISWFDIVVCQAEFENRKSKLLPNYKKKSQIRFKNLLFDIFTKKLHVRCFGF